jgi:50S ribosomal protein L16 3-hydroxylase
VRHPYSRAVWRRAHKGARLFVSGLGFTLPARDAQRLAAATQIDGALYTALSQAGRDAVFALMEAGHYQMLMDEDE